MKTTMSTIVLFLTIPSVLLTVLTIKPKGVFKTAENQAKVNESIGNDSLEVLLIGTFHFSNFDPANNKDVAKTKVIDVLLPQHQNELEVISERLKAFKPDKFFVEQLLKNQGRLDSIYENFKKPYPKAVRNETIQLAFRTAKKLGHPSVYAYDIIDGIQFPYKEVLESMEKAGQKNLLERNKNYYTSIEAKSKSKEAAEATLTSKLLDMNKKEKVKARLDWYLNLMNRAGTLDDQTGSFLVSEWFRRNIYMYSLIQKQIEPGDKRIVVLAGASHITLFKQFIEQNPKWTLVELEDVLKP